MGDDRTLLNPGSREAQEAGCTCAVLDNNHGQGFPYRGQASFWISEGCPLHGWDNSPEDDEP